MNRTAWLAAAGAAAITVSALVPATSYAATPAARQPASPAGAVFVPTDATTGNAVAVYDRGADGTLQAAGTYPTGGLGGILTGSQVDHLASQGSLAYDRGHGLLYAVNAGSNTVTVFSVNGDHLVRRQVISSGGTFPVSIAFHGNLVYVLNARDGGAVQGFLRIGAALVKIPSWNRSLGLDPSETPEFTHTPGQIAFTPDGSGLIITTKGNGNDIDVFRVTGPGGLAAAPAVTADPGNVPFGVTFDAGGHLLIAEAGDDAVAAYTVNRNETLTLTGRVFTSQAATCWLAPDGPVFYASNAGSDTLSGYRDTGSGQLRALGTTSTDAGTIDASSSPDGRYLYVRAGAQGIVDEYRAGPGGALTQIGSVTVPAAAGGEGIAVS